MPRKKTLTREEWTAIWDHSLFSGATQLALENLAKRIGINFEELKKRIMRE